MAALLVALAIMAVIMTVALPAWRHANQREKEEELVFRGRQYVRAIQLFQRRYAAAYPPDVDTLVNQKFLRRKYKDPMVADGEFEILYQGSVLNLAPGRGAAPQGSRSTPGRGTTGGPTPGAGASGQRGSQPAFTFDSRSGAVTQSRPAGGGVGPRGGLVGVRSKSTAESIRVYNGATRYNEWQFVFVPAMPGAGQGRPGQPGGGPRGGMAPGGMPGGRGGPGMQGGQRGPGMGGQRGGPGMGGQRGGRGPGG
jgi:type II secretory pathway pseudopilin PulG